LSSYKFPPFSFVLGNIVPVEITIFKDQTFSFVLKTPPAGDLLKKAAGVDKASGTPQLRDGGAVSKSQIREIATLKMSDLNAADIEGAMKIIEGSARSMGIVVTD